MQVNGTTVPNFIIVPLVGFIFWLGSLSVIVDSLAEDVSEHTEKPMHEKAISDVATIKNDVKHNKEAIDKIEKKLEEAERQRAKDKDEILKAIRESE